MIEWLNEIPVAIQIILGLAMFFPAMFGGIMVVAVAGAAVAIVFSLAVVTAVETPGILVRLWKRLWK